MCFFLLSHQFLCLGFLPLQYFLIFVPSDPVNVGFLYICLRVARIVSSHFNAVLSLEFCLQCAPRKPSSKGPEKPMNNIDLSPCQLVC